MSLRFICIELRKNLRCANVFLQFDQSLTETEFLKIQVDSDAIRLKEYSTETCAQVQQHFTIEARSMNNLIVEECNASFRITIEELSVDDNIEVEASMSSNKIVTDLKPKVTTSEAVIINCTNCKGALTQSQLFQRVLEFPSDSIDMGEFFCHHGPDFGEVLVPQTHDLFFGFQFLVLNAELMREKTKEKDKHLYCRRCLRYLGETLFNSKAAKVWSDSVVLQKPNDGDTEQQEVFEETPLTPTCQLLHKIIRESNTSLDNNELLQQFQFSKVLLEAVFPNRQRRYLLLHILEKHLEVLRNTRPLAHGSIHNNNNTLQVDLKTFKCFKLMYRLIDEENHAQKVEGQKADAPLLAVWKQDISIYVMKISPTLFSDLLSELDENSLLLPELYRFSNDDFQLSYVFYNY